MRISCAPNPCRRIQLPKVQRNEQRFLTEQEVEDLVAAMDRRYRVLVYVSAYLGIALGGGIGPQAP